MLSLTMLQRLLSSTTTTIPRLQRQIDQYGRRIRIHTTCKVSYVTVNNKYNVSVYVHWPYCRQLCPYCAFNKYRQPTNYSYRDELRMQNALVTELKHALNAYTPYKPSITSIYFGGGTPSLAKPSTLEAVINTIQQHANLTSNAEISLEANPVAFDMELMRSFKSIGINRISLGVQALNDHDLKWLGREHTRRDALHRLN
ncbi:hypothetical protein BDF22DRAFT_466401 [Syncephalis plumigaleata]|nr:hypothetical protein BDF22DRAFT_466401 [Syncephalis plumigaleata]